MATPGTGIDLDEHYDIIPTPTGDIELADGREDLGKDLAYRIAGALRGFPGSVIDRNTEIDIISNIQTVAEREPRGAVRDITIIPETGDDLIIELLIRTDGESFTKIITI